jgi:P protein
MLVGSIFVYSLSFLHYRLLYADPQLFEKDFECEFDELKKEITLWTRTYQNITPITKEEKIVKTLLKEKVSQLETLLSNHVYKTKHEQTTTMHLKSKDMVEQSKINDKSLLIKCSLVFLVALVMFFIHPFITSMHLSIGWISILSASVLLVISSPSSESQQHDINATNPSGHHQMTGVGFEALMHKVEWSTLLFFSGLFIFMKSIEELGLLRYIGELMSNLIKSISNESDRLVIALLILTLLSALISSLIDNIPFTTAMIPIVLQLSEETNVCC